MTESIHRLHKSLTDMQVKHKVEAKRIVIESDDDDSFPITEPQFAIIKESGLRMFGAKGKFQNKGGYELIIEDDFMTAYDLWLSRQPDKID